MTKTPKLGATPVKLGLVLALGSMLLAVWAPQLGFFGEGTRSTTPTAVSRGPRADLSGGSETLATPPESSESPPSEPRKRVPLAHAVLHDPFARPEWSLVASVASEEEHARSVDDSEQRAESLRSLGAKMLLVSEQGRAATIDGRTVRVGDLIDGFLVKEIGPAGVYLVPGSEGADAR